MSEPPLSVTGIEAFPTVTVPSTVIDPPLSSIEIDVPPSAMFTVFETVTAPSTVKLPPPSSTVIDPPPS